MKNIIALLTLLLISCSSKKEKQTEYISTINNLEQLKELRKKIESEKQVLSDKLAKINAKIKELEPHKNLPLITIQQLKTVEFKHYFEVQGNVETKENVLIYPETIGQLLNIYVKEGTYVKKGQILAKIDNGGLENQLAQLKVQRDLAKTTFERQQNLWTKKIGSEMQYLQAKANYQAQQKALEKLKITLDKYLIKAPFSGVIDQVFKERGVIISAGTNSELFRLVNLNNMYVTSDIPETHLKNIQKGKPVLVDFAVLNQQINSKIKQVGNYINPLNRTFKIEVNVPNLRGNIKPNMTARLKINDYTNPKAITIPQSIISENANGEQYVYILTNKNKDKGIAKRMIIKTGLSKNGNIEVLKGLSTNDEVIINGARTVKDNQEVRILTK